MKHPGYNENVNQKTLYFTAPGQVEIRDELLPEPGAHDVLVETICSAISAGTEMLIFQGRSVTDTSMGMLFDDSSAAARIFVRMRVELFRSLSLLFR